MFWLEIDLPGGELGLTVAVDRKPENGMVLSTQAGDFRLDDVAWSAPDNGLVAKHVTRVSQSEAWHEPKRRA